MIPPRFIEVLRQIRDRLEGQETHWAVVGSLGLAMRGLPLEPHDIDIMSDEAGAHEIERVLSEFVKKHVYLREGETLRSHFGELEVNGVKVEIMGDLRIRSPDGTWEELVAMRQNMQIVFFEEMRVPVLSLECERRASLRLGRPERAEMIREHLTRLELR